MKFIKVERGKQHFRYALFYKDLNVVLNQLKNKDTKIYENGGIQMEAEFLHHLRNAVPKSGYGNRLSMYLISLEAWRRGLKVTYFYEKNPENKMLVRYTLADEKNEYYFNSSLGDKLTEVAFDISENKDKTKKDRKSVV